MTVIRANSEVVTQINVFEIDPKNQDGLAALLLEAIQSVCHVPGWISANIHKSLDGTRVVNYAQAKDYTAGKPLLRKSRKRASSRDFKNSLNQIPACIIASSASAPTDP